MMDVYYVPEIELVDEQVSLLIVDITVFTVDIYPEIEELLGMVLCCKDAITLEQYKEDTNYSEHEWMLCADVKHNVTDTYYNVVDGFTYVDSLVSDSVNIYTPEKSWTIDRIISFNPTKILILLRGADG